MALVRYVVVSRDPVARARGNRRAIVAMVACFALFLINDALVKTASESLPTGQTIFLRGCFSTLMILVVATALGQWRQRRRLVQPLVSVRAVLDAIGTITYLAALFQMPIGNATAINLSSPLMLTAVAALLLGEHVGWRHWSAVLVGFAGVLLVMQPATDGFNAWSVLALGATVFHVGRDLVTRWIDITTPALLVTLAGALGITIAAGGVTLIEGWVDPPPMALLQLAISAAFLSTAYYLSVIAMRLGEVSVVAPFRYSAIPIALLLGWFQWGEVPDPMSWAGIALLVGAGLYVLHAERTRRQTG